jgi:hypothetical protein
MTGHGASTAHEVHGLLLDAHPEIHDVNLAKAAHLAETAGVPSDHLQLETFVAIRNPSNGDRKWPKRDRNGDVIVESDSPG